MKKFIVITFFVLCAGLAVSFSNGISYLKCGSTEQSYYRQDKVYLSANETEKEIQFPNRDLDYYKQSLILVKVRVNLFAPNVDTEQVISVGFAHDVPQNQH
jgi:hypothetical protein